MKSLNSCFFTFSFAANMLIFIGNSYAFAGNTLNSFLLKQGLMVSSPREGVMRFMTDTTTNSARINSTCQATICTPFSINKSKTLVQSKEMFSSFLADSTMRTEVTNTHNTTIYEYGLRFQVTQNGIIVKVGSKLPNAGVYRVSVWDAASKTVLAQKYVVQYLPNVQAWADVPELALEANKDYFISIISDNWNDAYLKSGSLIAYPLVKDNFKIMAFAYTSQPSFSAVAKFPDIENNKTSIYGFVDFGFIAK
ncbi:hypothetical protein [Emticicia sp. 17c]|uniref:hypothetical protein n=1 Tax=Emticicia sp. 17c TaxID=3127704 RepID=UPI00301C3D9D